jgi:cyclic pyranopterin phosphate synthase
LSGGSILSLSLSILRNGRGLPAPLPEAPESVRGAGSLIDSHGRSIRDLRLSITDRCNFRCVYCMDPDTAMLPRAEMLSAQELVRVARVCVGLGVRKVRITGGEPTVHPGLLGIIEGVAAGGAADIAMTTNGMLVDEPKCRAWRGAGLTRLTFSLDSLDPIRFAAITRSSCTPARVVGAVEAALGAGFASVKVNAVVVRGVNDDEVAPLAGLARRLGIEMRFIEFMPLDSGRRWDRSHVVPAAEIVERIGREFPLELIGRDDPSSTALEYRFADGAPGRVGVIAPVTRPFCGACSRLRVTVDGKVRPCLFSREEWDVRPLLRGGGDDAALARFLADVTWTKQKGHGISLEGFVQPERTMSAIGG